MPKALLKNGLHIHYQRVGEGPDIVFLHGLMGNLAVWHLKIVPILRHHFRVTTVDLRGHGYSDMPPTGYSVDDLAGDLLGVLDALEIDRADLVGHSYGADIALCFALHHPERVQRVVAIEAGLPALAEARKQRDWDGWAYWANTLRRAGLEVPPEKAADLDFLVRQTLKMPIVFGPAAGRLRKADPILRLLDTTTLVKDYEVLGSLTTENIPRIQTPVLLIFGDDSAFLPTHDFLLQQLPNASTIKLPDAYHSHFGPLEHPEILAEHILANLAPAALAAAPDRTDAEGQIGAGSENGAVSNVGTTQITQGTRQGVPVS